MAHPKKPATTYLSPKAQEAIVRDHTAYVWREARKLSADPDDVQDLAQEGLIGLLEAARRFDPGRGFAFLTYAAHWVHLRMREYARRNMAVHTPVAVGGRMIPIGSSDPQIPPSDLGVSVVLVQCRSDLALPAVTVAVHNNLTIALQCLERLEKIDVEIEVLSGAELEHLKVVVDRLPQREALIMFYRLGLDGNPQRSLQDIGDMVNLSRERVRQLAQRATKSVTDYILNGVPIPSERKRGRPEAD